MMLLRNLVADLLVTKCAHVVFGNAMPHSQLGPCNNALNDSKLQGCGGRGGALKVLDVRFCT